MLRSRPERCPLCGHDVRGVARCEGCGERLLVANDPAPPPRPVRRALGAAGSVLAGATLGMGIAVAGVVHPLLALALVAAVPVTAGSAGAVSRFVRRRRERAWRKRERLAPTPEASMNEARQALAADAGAIVSVRGRVHLEIAAVEGVDHAVARGTAGRFVVYASDGEAVIDDDRVEVAPSLVVRDGDDVEVTGPARLISDDTIGDYRAARARIVFSGTEARPLTIRAR
ncbi:MAG: hypothetical protein K1X94_08325 [Sandaracinaceae bacterium]|nr:hypothetical protein [Sandaracinaceae bacterium]